MVFPSTPLNIKVEIAPAGTWINITDFVYLDDIVITRGSADETSTSQPSRCTIRINNRDGRFSPRNPGSPYFGTLGRNTPILVSVKSGDTFLDVPGSGSASTPDAASLDITGDIDVRFEATLADWTAHEGITELIGKLVQAGNQRSWLVTILGGNLRWEWSADGINTTSVTSTRPLTSDPSDRLAVRVTQDVNNGASGNTVTFYTAPTIDGPWTQLGDAVVTAGTTSIFNSTAPLRVGDASSDVAFTTPNGRIHAAQVYNGISGTLVANPDFTSQTVGAASFVDSTGKTWTMNSPASINNQYNRFRGEVIAWPSRWEEGNFDVWVPLEAASLLRRHNQGAKALNSTLTRRIPTDPNVVAYWPMEDGTASTQLFSPLPGVGTIKFTGDLVLQGHPGPDGSDALPMFNEGCSWFGVIPGPSGASANAFQVEWAVNIQQATATLRTIMQVYSTGTVRTWKFQIDNTGIRIVGSDRDGTVVVSQSIVISQSDVINHWARWRFQALQNGGNVDWDISIIPIGGTGVTFGASYAGTVGRASAMGGPDSFHVDIAGLSQGHFAAFNDDATQIFDSADHGFTGETAWARMDRLTSEQGERVELVGNATDSVRMGAQRPDKLIDLLQECADTDRGILTDSRNGSTYTRFRLVGKASLYNQTPRLILGYTDDGEVHAPLDPTDDDRHTRNAVTATRERGSSAYVEENGGPLGINKVGLYDTEVTINPEKDDRLIDFAGWEVHLGTWNEERYPTVLIRMQAAPGLIPDALNLDQGSVIRIVNARNESTRTFISPGDIDLMILGYQERMSQFTWEIEFQCVPARPWNVAEVSSLSSNNWTDTSGTSMAEALDSTETGFTVFTDTGVTWTDDAEDYPFDLTVGGERVTAVGPGGVFASNSLLLSDASGWTAQNGSIVYDTSVHHPDRNSNGSIKVTPDGVSASGGALAAQPAAGTANPGGVYKASMWVYSPLGWSDLRPVIDWYDSAGTFISTGLGSATVVPAGVWTYIEQSLTAPASTSRARFRARYGGTPAATDVFYVWAGMSARIKASWAYDQFGRTDTDTWTTTDSMDTWTNSGGAATDYDVLSGYGRHTLTSVSVSRRSGITAPSGFADFDIYGDVATSATATGGSIFGGLIARYADGDNLYHARLEFTTTQTIILSIRERVAAVETQLGTFTADLGAHTAATFYRVRFQGIGTALKAKVWRAGSPEPDPWQIEVSDSSLTAEASMGFRSILAAGNTNVNPEVRFDNFELVNPQALVVVRSREGVVKTHSQGAPISLTYPMHLAL